MKETHVLLIDDQEDLLTAVQELLEANGMIVTSGRSCADAERLWKTSRPDLAILDYMLPDGNAIGLIQKFKENDASVPIIVLTGYGTIERAVEAAYRRGARTAELSRDGAAPLSTQAFAEAVTANL